jgi:putative ABC transport system permease protein
MFITYIAILISCLGLFGLAAYSVERRTKEVGIRKTFGASVNDIVKLLSGEFVILVLISNLIAWPIAYYAADRWLQNFYYRTDIGVLLFLLSGAIALVIAFLTVRRHAVKAAAANPVESLRYE